MLQTSLPGQDQIVIQVDRAEQSSHYLHLLLRSRLRWEDMVSGGQCSGGSQYMYGTLLASLKYEGEAVCDTELS